jgi:hypothetical protein
MPKPFFIGVEIEETKFGAVIRRLNALEGITKIHFNMDRDKVGGSKPNGSRHSPNRKAPGRFDIPGEQAILQLLYGKPPMTSQQLADAFEVQGRSPKSISSCLHKLRSNGDLSSGPQGYSLTKKSRDRLRSRKSRKS